MYGYGEVCERKRVRSVVVLTHDMVQLLKSK
jgi:hypothetical protein